MDEDLKIAVEYHESGKGLVSLGDLAELAREINKRDREIQQLQADKAELMEILGGAQFLIQCLASKLDLSYGMEQQISEFMRDYESVTAKHGSDK